MVKFDKNKKELVFPTVDFNDKEILKVSLMCRKKGIRLVLITPTIKQYPENIDKCFAVLGDDLLIFEMGMGMRNVLNSRAKKYIQYVPNATIHKLIPELPKKRK